MQKKWVIGITAMSLVATTAIGSTLAYFTTKTQQMTNTFTVAAPNGVSAQLREPTWDGFQFDQTAMFGKIPDGTIPSFDASMEKLSEKPKFGINQAAKMMPGAVISKDPRMKNTTNWNQWGGWNHQGALNWGQPNVPVYMAMKVDTNKFNNASINAPTENSPKNGWQLLPKKYYKFNNEDEVGDIYLWCDNNKDFKPAEVQSGGKTNALFDTVTVGSDAIQNSSVTTKANNAALELKNFDIQVQGAAVQSANLDDFTKTDTLPTIEAQLVGELGAKMN